LLGCNAHILPAGQCVAKPGMRTPIYLALGSALLALALALFLPRTKPPIAVSSITSDPVVAAIMQDKLVVVKSVDDLPQSIREYFPKKDPRTVIYPDDWPRIDLPPPAPRRPVFLSGGIGSTVALIILSFEEPGSPVYAAGFSLDGQRVAAERCWLLDERVSSFSRTEASLRGLRDANPAAMAQALLFETPCRSVLQRKLTSAEFLQKSKP
jgi:hypothetical protein